jgi:hypothetical protein
MKAFKRILCLKKNPLIDLTKTHNLVKERKRAIITMDKKIMVLSLSKVSLDTFGNYFFFSQMVKIE